MATLIRARDGQPRKNEQVAMFRQRPVPFFVRVAETSILTGTAIALGRLCVPDDPLLLGGPFPWLTFPPLLAGLQHGFVSALLSGGIIAVAGHFFATGGHEGYEAWLAGCTAVGLLAGQYRDAFNERLTKIRDAANEDGHLLADLQRRYHLLNDAHAELRAVHGVVRASMSEAVERTILAIRSAPSLDEGIALVLELLSAYGQVQSASLYLVRHGVPSLRADGQIGDVPPHGPDQGIVRTAVRERRLVSVAEGDQVYVDDRSVLAAVPLISPSAEVVAVVAVHDMPFAAFDAQHLLRVLTMACCVAEALAGCVHSRLGTESRKASHRKRAVPSSSGVRRGQPESGPGG